MLWMEVVVGMKDGTKRKCHIGRGEDRCTYLPFLWLGEAEQFVAYCEGEDVIGPGGDYLSTMALRRLFPRFRENRHFLISLESKARQLARSKGWP
jgi:hypothetical protein